MNKIEYIKKHCKLRLYTKDGAIMSVFFRVLQRMKLKSRAIDAAIAVGGLKTGVIL